MINIFKNVLYINKKSIIYKLIMYVRNVNKNIKQKKVYINIKFIVRIKKIIFVTYVINVLILIVIYKNINKIVKFYKTNIVNVNANNKY